MNLPQWITVIALGFSIVFIILATLSTRLIGRMLAHKDPDFLDRVATAANSVIGNK